MKNHTLASIKFSTYMLVPALCFGLRWCGYPFQRACIIFNQFVYAGCAAKSVKTEAPSLN